MDPSQSKNLEPASLVAVAQAKTNAAFVDAVGAGLLLLRIDEPNGELVRGLREAPTAGGDRLEPMGQDTAVHSFGDGARNFRLASQLARAKFGPAEVHDRLLRSLHFAAPLRKRTGASSFFTKQISVGRARTNDIVLRHHSVSKFHAWFECDEGEAFYVTDAKSTNKTLVNGTPLARGRQGLSPGDEIAFGDVTTTLCTPEILWDALRISTGAGTSPRRR